MTEPVCGKHLSWSMSSVVYIMSCLDRKQEYLAKLVLATAKFDVAAATKWAASLPPVKGQLMRGVISCFFASCLVDHVMSCEVR